MRELLLAKLGVQEMASTLLLGLLPSIHHPIWGQGCLWGERCPFCAMKVLARKPPLWFPTVILIGLLIITVIMVDCHGSIKPDTC